MSLFSESGVQVDLTGKPHFRFQDLEAYRSIKGQHVQEMDVPDWFKPQFDSLKKRFRTVLKGKMALFDTPSLIVCMPGQLKKTPFAAYLQSVGDI